ncbi:branched-chain amino acid ABC transporter permease [Alicycliphilus denitrificans]|uniref:ABC-type transporter, integral membrane subunit n=2 Tax=Alicycliphilus denitrificans TaxID=179636 RepID=F4GFE1_ALIDK|nr:branched-chain amino acid ABC transporter permease [Alicycliphilus denitrificans]ADV00699.1 inner-membrane translocator [Alicycliphilus denitrificans BC]AEB83873.1 ABC-type transporter, integral membrane subunit [Alicycliphilus denitrificans K601]QKD44825.1 branched-chain amino acid ABC transporter permease [Alicycliphilus denitrificans]GAO24202.1 ABC transporter permease [Alicycliphilus sp. B1]
MTEHKDSIGIAAIGCVLLACVALGSGYVGSLMVWMALAAALAASLRFVLLIGELNFASAAFYGLGAYCTGTIANTADWPFAATLALSSLLALAVSIVFGGITLKVKGPYFLLIGFAFTEAMRILYTRTEALGGNSGLVGIFPPAWLDPYYQYFATALCFALILGMLAIERSHLGKIFVAIRDNENVVRSVGNRVFLAKVACFAIASAVAGLVGSLHAYANNVISPLDFGFMLSTFALAYLKVGGEDSPLGPVIGAVLLVGIASWAQSMGGSEHILYGLAIVLSVLFMPKGLMGLLERLRAGRGGR